jgi:hypothetical protein
MSNGLAFEAIGSPVFFYILKLGFPRVRVAPAKFLQEYLLLASTATPTRGATDAHGAPPSTERSQSPIIWDHILPLYASIHSSTGAGQHSSPSSWGCAISCGTTPAGQAPIHVYMPPDAACGCLTSGGHKTIDEDATCCRHMFATLVSGWAIGACQWFTLPYLAVSLDWSGLLWVRRILGNLYPKFLNTISPTLLSARQYALRIFAPSLHIFHIF